MSLNLRSLLSRWFFGSSGQEDSGLSTNKRLLIFSCLLIILYAPVWLLFQQARPAYHRALNVGAQRYFELADTRIDFRIEREMTVFRCYLSPPFEAELSPEPLFSNLPFLLALILATPGLSLRKRSVFLALGLLTLYATHVAFLVTKVEASLITANHPEAGNRALWDTLDNFFEIYGKAFFPIVIWLAVGLPYLLGRVDPARRPAPMEPASRNAPCPCGSGRKYKKCCGR